MDKPVQVVGSDIAVLGLIVAIGGTRLTGSRSFILFGAIVVLGGAVVWALGGGANQSQDLRHY